MKFFNRFLYVSCLIFLYSLTGCSKSDITEDITSVEKQVKQSEKIESIDYNGVKQMQERLSLTFAKQSQNIPKLKAGSPIYVGVLCNSRSSGTNPNVYGVIEYFEDLEDNKPASGYRNGSYGSLTTAGMSFDSHQNATWYVCIVDGSNFALMNKGYAVFALSPNTFLNSSQHVMLSSDDEDRSTIYDCNTSRYISSNLGFMPSNSGLPVQPGSFSNGSSTSDRGTYTNFQLYYFPATASSTAKLPNLGFDYSVFGNFGVSSKQNMFYFDCEDVGSNCTWSIYDGYTTRTAQGWLDQTGANKIIYQANNIEWYIQSSVGYTN